MLKRFASDQRLGNLGLEVTIRMLRFVHIGGGDKVLAGAGEAKREDVPGIVGNKTRVHLTRGRSFLRATTAAKAGDLAETWRGHRVLTEATTSNWCGLALSHRASGENDDQEAAP